MANYRNKFCRPQVVVTILVALGLLFMGVRVPDFSRPHGPRPTHRIVLETQHKGPSNHLKQYDHVVAVLQKLPAPDDPVFYRTVSLVAPPPYTSPLPPATSGRSPPAANL